MIGNYTRGSPQLGYRARQVLDYVAHTIEARGRAPTYSMIADHLGMSRADVAHVVQRLEKRGLLQRRSPEARIARGWHRPVIALVTSSPA